MKSPAETHILEQDSRFADCELPTDAVLYGFTIDHSSDRLNAEILAKLQAIEFQSPTQIVLDGELGWQKSKGLNQRNNKRVEAPFSSFVLAFEKKINLVTCRLQRMLELQDVTAWKSLDWLTYRDMVIVQIAAMSVDDKASENGGYTMQSLLRRIGQDSLVVELDKVLNKTIAVDSKRNSISVRCALRIVRDKFLCHYDNHEYYDLHGNDKKAFWSLSDMFVLEQLLLPPIVEGSTRIGAVRELVLKICQIFLTATSDAKWKMFISSLCKNDQKEKTKRSNEY